MFSRGMNLPHAGYESGMQHQQMCGSSSSKGDLGNCQVGTWMWSTKLRQKSEAATASVVRTWGPLSGDSIYFPSSVRETTGS
ncbi:hypothetical protein ACOSQ2_016584 [Xanthoceras sorbifolium]